MFNAGMGEHHSFYHWKNGEARVFTKYKYTMEVDTERKYVKRIDYELDGEKFQYVTESLGTRGVGTSSNTREEVDESHGDVDWTLGHVITPESPGKKIVAQYCTNECLYERCRDEPVKSNY